MAIIALKRSIELATIPFVLHEIIYHLSGDSFTNAKLVIEDKGLPCGSIFFLGL